VLKLPDTYSGTKGEILVTHDSDFGYTPYNAVLNLADVSDGSNKFYKIAIIKVSGSNYKFVNSWGRIGTDIGGEQEKTFKSQGPAIDLFVEKFEKFCKFRWDKRHRFKKQPGGYQWVNLDDGTEAAKEAGTKKSKKVVKVDKKGSGNGSGTSTQLDDRVRKFLSLIFDQEMMTKTLMRFNVDLKKMPLGKISGTQIMQGYGVLSSIAELLAKDEKVSKARFTDLSNQFYTLIPHDFGHEAPPVIDSLDAVKVKLELVEALIDIGDAVEIIEQDTDAEDPMMEHYRGLRSQLQPLDRSSDRFKLLSKYMHEGHDSGSFNFGVKVVDIFEIQREDEGPEHVAKYKDLENRQLLWHGSRLSNWASIISKGLRIAPPEAPKTGYRLGKGIYLADTVSKSGSYCFTNSQNPTGVMMLAESILGKQWTTKKDKFMEKPQPKSHSTYAFGQIQPDPKETVEIEGVYGHQVAVPCGKPKNSKYDDSRFRHDEFVVYDTQQVTMRYLFIVEFDHSKQNFRW
jgi:poly [ADP-ribose] polymerase